MGQLGPMGARSDRYGTFGLGVALEVGGLTREQLAARARAREAQRRLAAGLKLERRPAAEAAAGAAEPPGIVDWFSGLWDTITGTTTGVAPAPRPQRPELAVAPGGRAHPDG